MESIRMTWKSIVVSWILLQPWHLIAKESLRESNWERFLILDFYPRGGFRRLGLDPFDVGLSPVWWRIWWQICHQIWWRIWWITKFGDGIGDKFGDEFGESPNMVKNSSPYFVMNFVICQVWWWICWWFWQQIWWHIWWKIWWWSYGRFRRQILWITKFSDEFCA